jgi:hypothetical protein
MLDFDERDLMRFAEEAGFFPIDLTVEAVIEQLPPRAWEGFLNGSGNPNIPTLAEAVERALTVSEREPPHDTPSPARRARARPVTHGNGLSHRDEALRWDALAAADRGDHVDARTHLERGVERSSLFVDVDVDVLVEDRARLAEPVAQARPALVQLFDRVGDRGGVEL